MTITFFGVSGSIHTAESGNTSFAVQAADTLILVDCSGNPVQSLKKSCLNLEKLAAIFLTHAHIDHLYALPSLLHNLWLLKRKKPLHVYAEKNTIETAQKLCEIFLLEKKSNMFPIVWINLENTPVIVGGIAITAFDVCHNIPEKGLVFVAGSKKIVYFADTAPLSIYPECTLQADILIHECAGIDKDAQKINNSGHSTARQTAQVALDTGAKKLFLCHLPPEKNEIECIVSEIKSICTFQVFIPVLYTTYDTTVINT